MSEVFTQDELREEGKKAFLDSPYDINRNPYSLVGDDEEMEKRRQWQDGWNDSQATGE